MRTKKPSLFAVLKTTLLFALPLLLIGLFISIQREFWRFRKDFKAYKKVYKVIDLKFNNAFPLMGGMPIPPQLRNIPLAESDGIVVDVKKIALRDIVAPYNPSIIEQGDRFFLFFRYDVFNRKCPFPFYTNIGCAELDKQFNQTEKDVARIDTKSKFSEDPRIFKVGEEFFLTYNDLSFSPTKRRTIHVASLNLQDLSIGYITNLDIQRGPVEKNWIPFEYAEPGQAPHLYFEYERIPRNVFKVPDTKVNQIEQIVQAHQGTINQYHWPITWGKTRGGTPARRIGDEYLAFFHSSFRDDEDISWYVMGAYTFEAKPPFRITSISHYPILFKGIYDSPPLNTANPALRCIFPAGFALENRDGRELIHVACGENDAAIKIVTIDQEVLLKSMKKLP
jgi:predicted GH43/DUF377 family glycosyl hydrolase